MSTFGLGTSIYSSGYFYNFAGTICTVPAGMYAEAIVTYAATGGLSTLKINGVDALYLNISTSPQSLQLKLFVPGGSTLATSVGGGQPTIGVSWVIFENT